MQDKTEVADQNENTKILGEISHTRTSDSLV